MQALIGLADGPTVSYLRLHYFSSEGTRAFVDAVNMAEYWGVEGYVIDLRNNPGASCISTTSPQCRNTSVLSPDVSLFRIPM